MDNNTTSAPVEQKKSFDFLNSLFLRFGVFLISHIIYDSTLADDNCSSVLLSLYKYRADGFL